LNKGEGTFPQEVGIKINHSSFLGGVTAFSEQGEKGGKKEQLSSEKRVCSVVGGKSRENFFSTYFKKVFKGEGVGPGTVI